MTHFITSVANTFVCTLWQIFACTEFGNELNRCEIIGWIKLFAWNSTLTFYIVYLFVLNRIRSSHWNDVKSIESLNERKPWSRAIENCNQIHVKQPVGSQSSFLDGQYHCSSKPMTRFWTTAMFVNRCRPINRKCSAIDLNGKQQQLYNFNFF